MNVVWPHLLAHAVRVNNFVKNMIKYVVLLIVLNYNRDYPKKVNGKSP